jgi:monooxygenase
MPECRKHPSGVDTEHFDVVIVGAGISGIGAAWHVGERCEGRTYVVLEARDAIGGTWDLFRYPGIRSDSDMFTLGFSFKPWEERAAIADGDAILKYLHETVREFGIDRHIRLGHEVRRADWSSRTSRWTVEVCKRGTGEVVRFTCNFLFMCSGYYDYREGYTPPLPNLERFEGRVVHPQKWTPDIDYTGKRVIVIGSGATAVTLVPELAKKAAHVTMLQRSPTWVISRPREDRIAKGLQRVLPRRLAYDAVRWKNVLLSLGFFQLSRRAPERVKKMLLGALRQELGEDYDLRTHFTPSYRPWDQRLCLVPEGDLFEAIRSGRASVATGHIETFTKTGVVLRSGEALEADLVVTATGLRVILFGHAELWVDGERVDPARTMSYKAMMLSDVPNFALSFGYTNASWTLKVDLTAAYVCRLLDHMRRHGYTRCVPRRTGAQTSEAPFVDFSSGYIQRALPYLPKQGAKLPWRLYQNYLLDVLALRLGRLEDGVMEFA